MNMMSQMHPPPPHFALRFWHEYDMKHWLHKCDAEKLLQWVIPQWRGLQALFCIDGKENIYCHSTHTHMWGAKTWKMFPQFGINGKTSEIIICRSDISYVSLCLSCLMVALCSVELSWCYPSVTLGVCNCVFSFWMQITLGVSMSPVLSTLKLQCQ